MTQDATDIDPGARPFVRLADLTWPEVEGLAKTNPICILPVGAIEAHGPHLPLRTDEIISVAMAEAGASMLAGAGQTVVMLPSLVYTPAPFADGFPGTLSIDAEAVTETIVGIGTSLATAGLSRLAVANSHLDPTHLDALHRAGRELEEAGVSVAFPDLTTKPWALRLTAEFKSGACHAGRFEGSVVLAARPDLVRTDLAAALPPNPTSLSDAIRSGKSSFAEAGGEQAYFGDPAAATAEEGRATIRILGEILRDAVLGTGEAQP